MYVSSRMYVDTRITASISQLDYRAWSAYLTAGFEEGVYTLGIRVQTCVSLNFKLYVELLCSSLQSSDSPNLSDLTRKCQTSFTWAAQWKLIIYQSISVQGWSHIEGWWNMNYDFAEASHFFADIRHCQQNESSKYSIKTSGLNFSFIILGLICNCRFVFCHFQAKEWGLRNYSFSSSSCSLQ